MNWKGVACSGHVLCIFHRWGDKRNNNSPLGEEVKTSISLVVVGHMAK